MTLAEYLEITGMRRFHFAQKAGLSASSITELLNGQTLMPSLAVAQKIEAATNGAVRPQDWYIEPAEKP